jgi:hypothetical protein
MPRDKGEEWKHVTVLSEGEGNSGVKKVKCVYCDKEFTGGADRIRFHLAGDSRSTHIVQCSAVPGRVAESFKRRIEEKEIVEKKKQKLLKLDVATSSLPVPAQASTTQGTISGLFAAQIGGKEAADRAIARLFYANAIPFNVADSRYFKEAIKAVAACGPTYVPPGNVLFVSP